MWIYIIPEKNVPYYRRKRKLVKRKYEAKDMIRDIVYSLLVLAAGSLAGARFYSMGIEETNIIMIYILVVLIISLATARRYYGIASAFLSVLIFNFLFTEPRFSMQAYDQAYPITFLVMFVTAVTTSSLTMRMKRQARQSAEASFRMKILFDTNYLLQNGNSEEEIVNAACSQLVKLLKRDVAFYGTDGKSLMSEPRKFRTEGSVKDEKYDENHEFAVASWVYSNNKRAGATTDTLGDAKRFYLSVRLGREVFGVAGIAIKNGEPLDSFDNSVMMSILGELALALKNQKETKERERAALNAKNQQLRANLLRSVSHDLRTPLTSIFGNTEILLKDSKSIGEEDKQRIYKDINNDSVWLIKIVENLLSITKIEDKSIELNMTTELMGEVIEEAVEHIRDDGRHEIRIIPGDELLLARMDGRLIMQVIINLIENAQKYTPDGSKIAIDAHRSGKNIIIRVADNGNGIDDKLKETIFNMFFTTDEKAADSNRSMGMGLALCKAIVNAHGGKITVTGNEPKGAVFTFTLPAGEVEHNG